MTYNEEDFNKWNKIKEGTWFYKFCFSKNNTISSNIAIIPQVKMYSSKRLLNKIGVMNKDDFESMKEKFIKLID